VAAAAARLSITKQRIEAAVVEGTSASTFPSTKLRVKCLNFASSTMLIVINDGVS
jgi:hypothetical protein